MRRGGREEKRRTVEDERSDIRKKLGRARPCSFSQNNLHALNVFNAVCFFSSPESCSLFFYSIHSASVTSWHDESSTALMNECSSSHKLTPLRAAAVDARHIFKSKSSTIGDRIATF